MDTEQLQSDFTALLDAARRYVKCGIPKDADDEQKAAYVELDKLVDKFSR